MFMRIIQRRMIKHFYNIKTLSLPVSFLALVSLSSCGAKKDVNAELEQYKYYTQSERLDKVAHVSTLLGVLIEVKESDFQSEYKVDRVLRLLENKATDLKTQIKDVTKIIIGTDFSVAEVLGKQVLTIDYDAAADEILDFIANVQKHFDKEVAMLELGQILPIQIVDVAGLSAKEIRALTNKMSFVAQYVDFSSDTSLQKIELGDRFSVLQNGIEIETTQSQENIVKEIRSAIEARLKLKELLTNRAIPLNFSVQYQFGVFTGSELSEAVDNLSFLLETAQTLNKRVKTLVIGKRWEYKTSQNPMVVLYDYKTSTKAFAQKFAALNPEPELPKTSDIKKRVLARLASKGILIDQVYFDFALSTSNINSIETFVEGFRNVLSLDLAKNLRFNAIYWVKETGTAEYFISTGALHVPLGAQPSTVVQMMGLIHIKNIEQIALQRMKNKFEQVGLQLSTYYPTSISLAEAEFLNVLSFWFKNRMNAEVVAKKDIKYVRLTTNEKTELTLEKYLVINIRNTSLEMLEELVFSEFEEVAPQP